MQQKILTYGYGKKVGSVGIRVIRGEAFSEPDSVGCGSAC